MSPVKNSPTPVEAENLRGVKILSRRDPDLKRVVTRFGPPPAWQRPPGFPTLVYIILEQQVSLASAHAAFQKLKTEMSRITPARFLDLDDDTLWRVGFSRQKMSYARGLAEGILEREIDLPGLRHLDDETAREKMMEIRGIGEWTADVYLMMCLGRMNIWPVGDLALLVGAQQVKGLRKRPTPKKLEWMGRDWQPWRSVAARILWHNYLNLIRINKEDREKKKPPVRRRPARRSR